MRRITRHWWRVSRHSELSGGAGLAGGAVDSEYGGRVSRATMGSTQDQLVCTSAFVMAPSGLPGLDTAGCAEELIEGAPALGVGLLGRLLGCLQQLQRLQPGLLQFIRREIANHAVFSKCPKNQSVYLKTSQKHFRRHNTRDQLAGKKNQRPGGEAGPIPVGYIGAVNFSSVATRGALRAPLRGGQRPHRQKQLPLSGLPNLQGPQGRHNVHEADDSEPGEITSDLLDRQGPRTSTGHLRGLPQTTPQTAVGQQLSNGHPKLSSFGKEGATGGLPDENWSLSGLLPAFNFPSSHGLNVHKINPVYPTRGNSTSDDLAVSSHKGSSSLTSSTTNQTTSKVPEKLKLTPSTATSIHHLSTNSQHSQASVIMDPQHLYQ
ncbi:hypothetical protein BIW11_13069, partial [Tropilaelaps mercedesae]